MEATAIRQAIAASPAIAALLPDCSAVAAALSVGRTKLSFYLITERTAFSVLGVVEGEAFLTAIENFAAANLAPEDPLAPYQKGVQRMIQWLKRDGLDVGQTATRQMLDMFVGAGLVNAQSAALIKALAEVPDPVSEYQVRAAVWNDDGSLAV